MMIRVIYISTSRTPIGRAGLNQILRTSRINNALAGITGLLIASDRRFLQALEGPEDAIDAALARISADPRHFAIVTLSRTPISERLFPVWAMGCQLSVAAGGTGAIDRDVIALTDRIRDPRVRDEFLGFAQQRAA